MATFFVSCLYLAACSILLLSWKITSPNSMLLILVWFICNFCIYFISKKIENDWFQPSLVYLFVQVNRFARISSVRLAKRDAGEGRKRAVASGKSWKERRRRGPKKSKDRSHLFTVVFILFSAVCVCVCVRSCALRLKPVLYCTNLLTRISKSLVVGLEQWVLSFLRACTNLRLNPKSCSVLAFFFGGYGSTSDKFVLLHLSGLIMRWGFLELRKGRLRCRWRFFKVWKIFLNWTLVCSNNRKVVGINKF